MYQHRHDVVKCLQLQSDIHRVVSSAAPGCAATVSVFDWVTEGAGVGKTQLVKGKLASLPEEMMSLTISFNYFTDVVSFQKVCCCTQ